MMHNLLNLWKYILVLPHLFVLLFISKKVRKDIKEDVVEMNRRLYLKKNVAFYLVYHKPYRNLFYYRIGVWSRLCSLFLSKYGSFYISSKIERIGGGAFVLNHPYGTILNCKEIGSFFTVCQLTTIGNAYHGRNDMICRIGDNVSLGANVNIIGKINIGNNVIVGAGSVVVKDVPDNCVVAGNPAKIIRKNASNEEEQDIK